MNQYIAAFLLMVLSMAIVPLETFHHHEEQHIICKNSAEHVEEAWFECDLCDFVLPVFDQEESNFEVGQEFKSVAYLKRTVGPILITTYQIPDYRGPPNTSILV